MVLLKQFKVLSSQIRHHKWLPRFRIYPKIEASQKENKIISHSHENKKTLLSEHWISFPAILKTEAF
jgi:glutamate mutase epsilon subunit